jgi:hypothetical protein
MSGAPARPGGRLRLTTRRPVSPPPGAAAAPAPADTAEQAATAAGARALTSDARSEALHATAAPLRALTDASVGGWHAVAASQGCDTGARAMTYPPADGGADKPRRVGSSG